MTDRGRDGRQPAEPGLAEPGLAEPGLAEPGLADLGSVGARELARLVRSTTPVVTAGLPLTLLLAVVAGAGRIVTALTVQYALDHGLLSPDRGASDVVAHAVLVGAAATVAAILASWWLNQRLYRRAEAALAELRTDGIARIHEIAPETFAGLSGADLVTRLTSDPEAVTTFVQNGGVLLLVNVTQMIIAGALVTLYSWQLALPVLGLAALLFVGMRRLQMLVARRYAAVRTSVSALQSTVGEAVTGIGIVRSTGTEQRTRLGLDRAVENTAAAQRRTLVPLHTNTALGEVAISVMTVFVVVAGTRWSTAHTRWEPALHLSAGELVAMLLLVTFFVRPLQALVQNLGEIQNAVVGWRRALEILATPSGVVDGADARELPPGPIAVELADVAAAYGAGPLVVEHLTVAVSPGEHVAVVGETGSGKSTFAKLLTRQIPASRGRVLLGGVPVGRVSEASFQRRVAIVPQDPFLFDATIAENIGVGLRGSPDLLDDSDVRDDSDVLDEIVSSLGLRPWLDTLPDGLDTRVGVRGERLSAGERQLVALARTALVDPDLLVLDEATSGVDPATDVRIQRALGALTVGRTTVSIAHRMVTAEHADRVLVLDHGRLVQSGRHADLVAVPGRYAELHAAWVEHTAAGAEPHETVHRQKEHTP
ncbi:MULTISPECIES: ABC transporter ATP-binding protein [Frankia]|uniref:ABC transporter ATP-binding protein n=1 Tax=Frankia alni (strain DSM 45986 / CECT 9034 / ACN14a) TaxID=326424 RepID=Q0RMW7_FRAAA|nr:MULTISPECIES: ABC transporter ATP-binding protein [Frankia]CAJ61129.1 putative ABC transporter ATP-binding protein [Frankia alni ACN14a]